MQTKFSVAIVAFLISGVIAISVQAQALPQDKQAEVAFDIRFSKLRESPLADTLRSAMETMQAQAGVSTGDVDIEKIDRIFGALSLPASPADFEAMEKTKELPMEFFARIAFVDEAAADEVMSEITKEARTVEKNGKTYYMPPEDEDAPQNMMAYRMNPTTIEVGTGAYLEKGTGKELFSEGLNAAWNKAPDHAIRLAIDLKSASDLIGEAIDMAKQSGPPMMGGFLDLIKKADDARLSIDLTSENLLVLAATGKDEDNSEELKQGLDAIMGMAKMSSQQIIPMLEQQDAAAAKVVGEILNSLQATRDGNDVQIAIPKPDGFDEAMKNLIENMPGGDF